MSALLFSGGLDSLCAAVLNPAHVLVRVGTGSRYDDVERARAVKVAGALGRQLVALDGVVNLGQFEADDALIPARNAMIILAAAQVDPFVTLVAVEGDGTHATDKDEEFAAIATAMLRKLFGHGNVSLPYRHVPKHRLLAAAHHWQPAAVQAALPHVFSCYQPHGNVHCGTCKACVRLYGAMAWNNLLGHGPRFARDPMTLDAEYLAGVYEGRGEERQAAADVFWPVARG